MDDRDPLEGWELLGDFTWEEERRPLGLRLAASPGRSLLLKDGTVYALSELSEEGSEEFVYMLRPLERIDPDEANTWTAFPKACPSKPVRPSRNPDEEVRAHVTRRRKAAVIEELLSADPATMRWSSIPAALASKL